MAGIGRLPIHQSHSAIIHFRHLQALFSQGLVMVNWAMGRKFILNKMVMLNIFEQLYDETSTDIYNDKRELMNYHGTQVTFWLHVLYNVIHNRFVVIRKFMHY